MREVKNKSDPISLLKELLRRGHREEFSKESRKSKLLEMANFQLKVRNKRNSNGKVSNLGQISLLKVPQSVHTTRLRGTRGRKRKCGELLRKESLA